MKRRDFLYVALFVAIMTVAAGFMPVWRDLDWRIFALLNRSPSLTVSSNIVLVDVPYGDGP